MKSAIEILDQNWSESEVTTNFGNEIKIDTSKESISYYTYEIDENETKRQIKILKPEFAYALEQELKSVFTT